MTAANESSQRVHSGSTHFRHGILQQTAQLLVRTVFDRSPLGLFVVLPELGKSEHDPTTQHGILFAELTQADLQHSSVQTRLLTRATVVGDDAQNKRSLGTLRGRYFRVAKNVDEVVLATVLDQIQLTGLGTVSDGSRSGIVLLALSRAKIFAQMKTKISRNSTAGLCSSLRT